MESNAKEFERLIVELLEANQFKISSPRNSSSGFSFEAQLGKTRWAVEVKYYRTRRAQPSLIEKAAAALLQSARAANYTKAMLVLSCRLDPDLRESLENRFNILFVDRIDISMWARQAIHLVDPLASLLEEMPESDRFQSKDIDQEISIQENNIELAVSSEGASLCRELRSLGVGNKHWSQYEDLCVRIIRYLFPNDLSGWQKQKRSDDTLNRYDLICRLSPTTEFWRFVDARLSSRYVLFEFKNYRGRIKQGQVLSTEKYLLPLALRRFGIILTRKGADKNAHKAAAGAMRESGKMMLILDDDDLCNLLHAKDKGDDPSDILFLVADEFLMTMNR